MVRIDEWYVPFAEHKNPAPEQKQDKHPALTLLVFDIIDSLKTSVLIVFLLAI